MSLRAAINSSLTSLDLSKQEFAVSAHNIANADEKDYSKLTINAVPLVMGGFLAGVDIASISTSVDQVLQTRLYDKIAQDSYNQVVNANFQDVSSAMGSPGDVFTLEKRITNLFSALEDFSRNPAAISCKVNAVNEFSNVATSISTLASSLQEMRLAADRAISTDIDSINVLLASAYDTAQTIYSLQSSSMELATAQGTFTGILEELSQYFDLYQYQDDVGHYKIFSMQGDNLVGDVKYFMEYTPQASTQSFINNVPLNAIIMDGYDNHGNDIGMTRAMLPAVPSTLMPTKYDTGRLGGWLALRDTLIPQALTQLDTLAKNIQDSFNAIHNNVNGVPPPGVLTSTNLMNHAQILGFTGSAMVSVVDNHGLPVAGIPALTLNLGALNTGNGPGNPNIEGIVQEIVYHFGSKLVTDKSIALGNLSDIKLVSLTQNVAPSSNFVFDLELDNFSQINSTVTIQSVTATDSTAANVLGSFNNAPFVVNSGTSARTGGAGPSITLSLPATINYPITVDMQVNVNNGANNIATLQYIINPLTVDNINGTLNQRVSVSSKVNPADPGTINLPTIPAPVLMAQLVDSLGNVVPVDATSTGLLQLTTLNSAYNIAINNMDSVNVGDLNNNILGTGLNFAQYLGLNDLFQRTDAPSNWHNLTNAAIYMGIRSDILSNPNNLAHAALTGVVNYTSPSQLSYQYQTSAGDNTGVLQMLSLGSQAVYFAPAAGLPAFQTSIAGYAGSIMSFNANLAYSINLNADQSQLMRQALFERVQSARGVDVNEEMANMIIFQQSFTASAKVIQNVRELMDILMNVL